MIAITGDESCKRSVNESCDIGESSVDQADGQQGHPGPIAGALAAGWSMPVDATSDAEAAAARGVTGGSTAARAPSPRYPVTISNWCASIVDVISIVRGPTAEKRLKGCPFSRTVRFAALVKFVTRHLVAAPRLSGAAA
jgi:hypothetical protein